MKKQDYYSSKYQKDMLSMSDKYLRFLDVIAGLAPKTFLDVGCGDGSFAGAVKDATGCESHGIEISEDGVEKLKAKGISGHAIDLDAMDLPFDDDYFDCVFCGEIIEHLFSPDHLLEELRRVIRKGGTLLLTTPNLASWFNRLSLLFGYQPIHSDTSLRYNFGHLWAMEPQGHLRLYTLRGLTKLLEAYGYSIAACEGIGINNKVGFGKRHKLVAAVANTMFKSPSINAGLFVMATNGK